MLQLLIKPLLGVAADAVKGFVTTKKLKAEQKLTKIKADTKLMEDQIAGKVQWEASARGANEGVVERRINFNLPSCASCSRIFSRND